MNSLEAPFEMANLFPKHTGLPFVVWTAVRGGARHDVRGGARHDVRVKVQAWPWSSQTTVALRPQVRVIEGEMNADALAQLKAWIELNRAVLISYWEGDIDTQDALEALVKV